MREGEAGVVGRGRGGSREEGGEEGEGRREGKAPQPNQATHAEGRRDDAAVLLVKRSNSQLSSQTPLSLSIFFTLV